jgi:DNA-binding IclR family transcriptional regulator
LVQQRQGIQSIEVGTRLLRALAASQRSMMLRDVARNAGMPAAKARRYLVSFMRMGLVEQDANTGRYDLGEFSLELGLASLARLDPVRLAGPVLDDLCEQIGATVALAMWGNHGATCVRWVEAGGAVTVTLRTGVVLPLTTSATGLAFSAFYRSPIPQENARRRGAGERRGQRERRRRRCCRRSTLRLDDIRRHGIARASGSMTPGINGFSAPVFGHTGRMVAAVTRWASSAASTSTGIARWRAGHAGSGGDAFAAARLWQQRRRSTASSRRIRPLRLQAAGDGLAG